MTDIVERLQAWAECGPNALLEAASADLFEAADEIDRLRAENERLRAALLRLRGLTSGMVRGYIDDALGGKP